VVAYRGPQYGVNGARRGPPGYIATSSPIAIGTLTNISLQTAAKVSPREWVAKPAVGSGVNASGHRNYP
jgi:hypothetical protein